MKRIAEGVLVALLGALASCTRTELEVGATDGAVAPAKYLYVFAGYTGAKAPDYHAHNSVRDSTLPSDFVAVIDVDSASPTYAQVVRVLPTGASASMPHHTEMVMPDSGWPFAANAHLLDATYLIDVRDAAAPVITGTIDSVPGFRRPHSFTRLPNDDLLGTYQYGNGRVPGNPGALARFTRAGRLLRVTSAADPAFAGQELRTYSLDVSPATDLVLTTSVPMDPAETTSADVVRLWRLSDLTLLRTLPLAPSVGDSTSRYPFEVRFLADGRSALLNTYYCGFYVLSELGGASPRVEPVLALSHPTHIGCAVPLLLGGWWIMPVASTREFIVYDVSNPRQLRRVGSLAADSTFEPHWISRDLGSDRLVMTAEGPRPAVRLARFDTTTGRLTWDERFRERPDGALGVSFDRSAWPGALAGRAAPHGALFSRR
ncbi:hypothetical protein [Gemmatimonas sp.]|uniref:hypothetical protein n=1 Tax=Gemmatimonas sp. TaxID=1962908 RepID=UPI0037C08CE4